jgi:hypothetical protein
MASKKKTAAKAKKSGSTQTKSPYGTKTAFVMGLPREMSARDVVSKGKAQGIKLSEAHVYKIRSTSKAPKGVLPRPLPLARVARQSPVRARRASSRPRSTLASLAPASFFPSSRASSSKPGPDAHALARAGGER